MILLSHPTGNQNVRHAALALAQAGLLEEFWTCINWNSAGILDRILPAGFRSELRRRAFPADLKRYIKTFPWIEAARQMASRTGFTELTRDGVGRFSVDAVYGSLDCRVARRLREVCSVRAVYAYDDGALATFRAAKANGLSTFYEHPITHWRKVRQLQEEEADLHPEWKPTLRALLDTEEKFARKDEELSQADVIIVPSTFSKESLTLAPYLKAAIHVVPYGAPMAGGSKSRTDPASKLKVLFVGGMGQAKGLGYLLEAADRLKTHIDLTLVGQRLSPVIPKPEVLRRWNWIPSLPHAGVLEQMARHDVLVLPSLHEGFALVLLEAMSQGLPVIATQNTGVGDLIADGTEGFLIPVRSSSAIVEKLELFVKDRELLLSMGRAAQKTVAKCSWEQYGRRLVEIVRDHLEIAGSAASLDSRRR